MNNNRNKNQQRNITPNFLKFKRKPQNIQASPHPKQEKIRKKD